MNVGILSFCGGISKNEVGQDQQSAYQKQVVENVGCEFIGVIAQGFEQFIATSFGSNLGIAGIDAIEDQCGECTHYK